jgi:hypothetical protein
LIATWAAVREDFGAVTCKEQSEGALIGVLEGCYGDAEGGCERVMELGEMPMELGVEGRKLRTGTGEERLEFPESHFNVVEAGEDVGLDVLSDDLRVLEGHLLGLDAYCHLQAAGGRLLTDIGEGEWYDSGERKVSLANSLARRSPVACPSLARRLPVAP